MIGQKENIQKLNIMKSNNAIPQLIIISGPRYSGKSSLIKEFANIIDSNGIIEYIQPGVKVIRDMLTTNTLATTNNKIYCIENFESLSKQAQSSVLKTFEETPKNCYFIISTNNIDYMLDTILSRGQLFTIENYTQQELEEYCNKPELYNRFNTPSKIDYWRIKDLSELDKKISELQNLLYTKSTIECYNLINKYITFDINSEGFYYLFFLEELDKNIKLNYKWKNEEQFIKYCTLLSEFYSKTNITTILQDALLDKLILNLHYLFQGV